MDARLFRLLSICFCECIAVVLLERGVYFYAGNRLGYTDTMNLWLALGIGLCYIIGAVSSHRLSQRFGEKRLLLILINAQIVILLLMSFWMHPVIFIGVNMLRAFISAAKWPVLASYVSAGRNAADTGKAVGWFSISWAMGVPISVAAVGPMISYWPAHWPPLLFLFPCVCNLLSLWLLRPLEAHPLHTPQDHPNRPTPQTLAQLQRMTIASRWAMMLTYFMLFLLVPLLKGIFQDRLGMRLQTATLLASSLDAARLVAFLLLQRFTFWHERRDVLIAAIVLAPLAFLMMYLGPIAWVVLTGALLFGLAAGLSYYAALYYAMLIKNASVDAGGAHEGLIGMGFALGPTMGLVTAGLVSITNPTLGTTLGIAPVLVGCTVLALWPLLTRPQIQQPQTIEPAV